MAERPSQQQAVAERHGHVGRYLAVWVALVVLTMSTWFISRFHVPGAGGIAIALVIAITKGGLVALFFMHLYDQQGVNRVVFATSLVFVALLVTLTLLDNATRFPLANPPGSAGAIPAPDFDPPPFERPR